MKSLLVITVAALGCNASAPLEPLSPPVKRPAAPSKPVEDEGLAQAAVASLPASEWPCGTRVSSREGNVRIPRMIEYARTSCIVPVTILPHTLGGCPSRVNGGEVKYDARGRVVEFEYTTFSWGTRGPIASTAAGVTWRFVAVGDDVATGDGTEFDEIARIDASRRVTRVDQLRKDLIARQRAPEKPGEVYFSRSLEYEGGRIVRTRFSSPTATRSADPMDVLYDCSAL